MISLPSSASVSEALRGRLIRWRVPLGTSLAVGLLAHGYAFANKLLNHDEVRSLFAKGATVESGRWGLGAMDLILPNYSMPWLYGLLTVFLIGLAVCLMTELFAIRSKVLQGLLAGLVLAFPALTGTFGYMFTSSAYGVSFLLAVLAVCLAVQPQWFAKLLGLGMLVGSLSIYQSYISIAAGLLVLRLILELLEGAAPAKVLKQGIGHVLFLILGLGLYYGTTQIVLKITGVTMSPYAEGSVTFSLSALPERILLAYRIFGQFFTENLHGLIPTPFSGVLHLALILGSLWMLGRWFRSLTEDRFPGGLLMVLLAAALPLAINCMYLITAPTAIHTLVLYGFFCLYLLPILLADRGFCGKIGETAAACLLGLIVTVNVFIANEAYLNLQLRYSNAQAFYTAVAADLNRCPDFQEGTVLALVGNYQQPDFYTEFETVDRITGVHGFVPDSYSRDYFLRYYLGFDLSYASEEAQAALAQTEEFQSMPVYPYYGSIQTIGDVLVVKIGQ